jgi:hypothetical protein
MEFIIHFDPRSKPLFSAVFLEIVCNVSGGWGGWREGEERGGRRGQRGEGWILWRERRVKKEKRGWTSSRQFGRVV